MIRSQARRDVSHVYHCDLIDKLQYGTFRDVCFLGAYGLVNSQTRYILYGGILGELSYDLEQK